MEIKDKNIRKETKSLTSIKELDQLIDLAEKISANIDRKLVERTRIYAALFLMIFFEIIIFFLTEYSILFQTELFNNITFITITIIIIFVCINLFNRIIKLQKEVNLEKDNLSSLLNLIYPYKSVNNEEISIIKRAIIDMRLNRIKFSLGK